MFEPHPNQYSQEFQLKSIILAIALLNVSLPTIAATTLTPEECKPQAAAAKDILDMIDSGSVPATEEHRAAVQKAVDLYQAGDYCAARQILFNLGTNPQK
jgi:hypothetical protein